MYKETGHWLLAWTTWLTSCEPVNSLLRADCKPTLLWAKQHLQLNAFQPHVSRIKMHHRLYFNNHPARIKIEGRWQSRSSRLLQQIQPTVMLLQRWWEKWIPLSEPLLCRSIDHHTIDERVFWWFPVLPLNSRVQFCFDVFKVKCLQ